MDNTMLIFRYFTESVWKKSKDSGLSDELLCCVIIARTITWLSAIYKPLSELHVSLETNLVTGISSCLEVTGVDPWKVCMDEIKKLKRGEGGLTSEEAEQVDFIEKKVLMQNHSNQGA